TAVQPSDSGYLTIYPQGEIRPVAPSLNFRKGQIVAGLTEVPVSPSGQISIYNGSAGTTNVIVDIAGYVATTGASYTPIAPLRICDTRVGNPSGLTGAQTQCNGHTLLAKVPLTINVAGLGTIPDTATAVVVNLTAISPKGSGYLTAYPPSTSPPTASNLNFATSEVVSNEAAVELSGSGTMDLVSNASTDVVVDVAGYFSASGSSYTPLSPQRIADTRCSTSPPPSF
ncbi:domain-containing protein-like protein, partial [mine drainage metagenome]